MSEQTKRSGIAEPIDEVAIIHHDGAYALWSLVDDSPLTTGLSHDDAKTKLVQHGFDETTLLKVLDDARKHGSSVPAPGYYPYKTASDVIEGNRGGAFGEEVPGVQMFRHILIERAPLP